MFVGRETELNFFHEKYNSKGGQLVVLYGRRRVGKTETLRKFCHNKPHVFYSCRECTDEEQLRSFSQRMLKPGMNAAKYINTFENWEQAFLSISELPSDGRKKLLVIDEFPYMIKGRPGITSLLQNMWDESLKNDEVMIILCGSAMSFIENEVLAEKNPLYGRATGILKMQEMNFYDAVKFFPDYSYSDKILAYAVLGGIPHYLSQFIEQDTLSSNIKKNILQKGSILYSEVEFLMRQELRETALYNTIIEAVAPGNTKMNGIHQKTQIEKSKLSVYLQNLIKLGIMERVFPVSESIKEQANIQRGLYKITDNFFCFWFAFVLPNISELEAGDHEGVYNYIVGPGLDEYASVVFEDICREYVRQNNIKGTLPFRYAKLGKWWNSMDELDLMAFDKEKNNFIIGECKYNNTPFRLSDFEKTRRKFIPKKEQAEIYYYLFSKSGFDRRLTAMAETDNNIILITLDQLFLSGQS